jgi:putative nucleotidyltransferase with HDIG domain
MFGYMEREKLFQELKKRVKEESIIKHMFAVEAIMRALAKKFNKDEDEQGVAGLLHDIDYDPTKDSPKLHSIVGAKILEKMDPDETIVQAIKSHNGVHGIPRRTLIKKALYAADPVSGLTTTGAIVKDKKFENVDKDFVLKRFQEKRFAEGVNRDQIDICKELELSLKEFVEIALSTMNELHKELGL